MRRRVAEIRLATPADGAQLSAIYASLVRDTAISFEVEPPDGAEMARRVAESLPAYRGWWRTPVGIESPLWSRTGTGSRRRPTSTFSAA
jgi:hypothetical protein